MSSDGATYVWQEVKMGFIAARSKLQVVDEATGRKGVGMLVDNAVVVVESIYQYRE